jgi:hypothetical protein
MFKEIPSEPVDIKNAMKMLMDNMITEAWDWQSLAVWYGNRLPQYLWSKCGWKNILSIRGWRWQSFLSLLSKHTHEIIRWANDEISWDAFVKVIESDMNSLIISKVYRLENFQS